MLSIVMIDFYMFARWSQENFFKYMMEHFDIDGLVSYLKETVSDTKILINPAYRKLESELRKLNAKLTRKKAAFATLTLKENQLEDEKISNSKGIDTRRDRTIGESNSDRKNKEK